jgi:hypothetical protein
VLYADVIATIHTHHDVGKDLVISHLDMSNSDTQTKNLLELELNRRPDFIEFVGEVLSVRDGSGELSG